MITLMRPRVRRLETRCDLSIPSAQTELLLSESLIRAAASIHDELLDPRRRNVAPFELRQGRMASLLIRLGIKRPIPAIVLKLR
jgi:hypothetical protein